MSVWRELLRRSAELLDQNGHAAIDATYFDRQQASAHYCKRTGRSIRMIQVTLLVDTAEGAILDRTRLGELVCTNSCEICPGEIGFSIYRA